MHSSHIISIPFGVITDLTPGRPLEHGHFILKGETAEVAINFNDFGDFSASEANLWFTIT